MLINIVIIIYGALTYIVYKKNQEEILERQEFAKNKVKYEPEKDFMFYIYRSSIIILLVTGLLGSIFLIGTLLDSFGLIGKLVENFANEFVDNFSIPLVDNLDKSYKSSIIVAILISLFSFWFTKKRE